MLPISELTFLKMKYVEGYTVRKKQEIVKTMPSHYEVDVVAVSNNLRNTTKLFVNANKQKILKELNSIDKGTNIIVVMSIFEYYYGAEIMEVTSDISQADEISNILTKYKKRIASRLF